MISIKYSSIANKITVIQGKSRKEFSAGHDVNLQALNIIKWYFVEEITRLCNSRINALTYATIKAHTGRKKEILFRVNNTTENIMKYPASWSDIVLTMLKQLKMAAPSQESRYYKNYRAKLLELYSVLQFYKDKKKYYEVHEASVQLDIFNNQQVT